MPVVLTIGGVTTAMSSGAGGAGRIIDMAKTFVVSFELRNIAASIENAGGIPGGAEGLSAFIRSSSRAGSGRKDPSLDYWGTPYIVDVRTDPQNGGRGYCVVSLGPNRNNDGTCNDGGSISFKTPSRGGGARPRRSPDEGQTVDGEDLERVVTGGGDDGGEETEIEVDTGRSDTDDICRFFDIGR